MISRSIYLDFYGGFMIKIKHYFKSKEFIITIMILLISAAFGIYKYFNEYTVIQGYFNYSEAVNSFDSYQFMLDSFNRYSFWYYTKNENLGSLVMFLSPVLISLLALHQSATKLTGSMAKDILMREKYSTVCLKTLLLSYVKAYFPFAIISLVLFIIGAIFFSGNILNTFIADQFTMFRTHGLSSPLLCVGLSFISLLLYVMMIVNISYIAFRITKKKSVTLILTLIIVNILNYVVSYVGDFIMMLFHVDYEWLYCNIYEGFLNQYGYVHSIVLMLIVFLVTCIPLFLMYRKKEKVVMSFE